VTRITDFRKMRRIGTGAKPTISICVLLLMLIWLLTMTVEAQVLYGTLTGNVTDKSGAAVAGARVEALNVETGVAQQTTSNNDGIYRFTALQPGNYKVSISAKGFNTSVNQSIPVVVNSVRRVDAVLAVAGTEQQVIVTAEAPLLQTDKADVHTDLTSVQVENLPTAGSQGRNFQSLLRVIPGAGLIAETNSLSGNPQRAINANVNGQSNQGVNTRI